MKRVTLKEIADRLNVSVNTVSLVLRNQPGISRDTREAVLKTAEQLGYQPRAVAAWRNVLILSNIENTGDTYFSNEFFKQIKLELELNGCIAVALHNLNAVSIERMREVIDEKGVEGIVVIDEIGEQHALLLQQLGLPVVLYSFYFPKIPFSSVMEDNISAMSLIVSHLRAKGYARIGFIGSLDSSKSFAERWLGTMLALKAEGMEVDMRRMFIDHTYSECCDVGFLTQLFTASPLPDALLCGNDKIAMASIKALGRLGYAVPRDIGVVGFDNSELAGLCMPTLTTVDNNSHLQARTVVRRLTYMMDSERPVPVERIITPVALVLGESC
ncbi:LacI family transcriptional regulator [Butyricicoccus faecihominis]|uniref:LacI family DNA-binding transcriptional regulator n=1 Tax=Butyricicoccaceae TaxID=3085642 RepID=UPI002479C547|nr:LacI family DNA-binding transcriptional regulator [Agathobaculum sp. NTUH-O15-33]MCQ5129609.1 LacI family transcriptional regulator [Butyricicoccus faecihominis]WNX86100.1 LacI family DNA-binding transcriptional regulator [Agathobaculum sp. NTUH-O15-33]